MFNLIAIAARSLGHPTTGDFAFALWEMCSGNRLDVRDAKALYKACGYVPFSGYPLTKA